MQLPRKMSAHNVMASISRSLGNRENKATAANEVRFAGEERKDKLYETKHKQKVVRVLTVVAYVIFVSKAAILLSLYYTFVWNPKDQSVRMMRLDKPECAKPSHDSLTTPPISNETQIEKLTARSTTTDNKRLEELDDLSTTQRQRGLWDILTESTDVEGTLVDFTSVSTMPDYRDNLTSTVNNGDDESVT
ncbi:hypothetical protein EAI_00374 [Harpegnathos saltator]|uniref:Transmembrane protein INAFM2 n=1 Tax=Harpegnathos saltator TaxID=610380 RepID=E2BA29_HARSA|nr:hypothetical protein EAI_00374 [Harpegnathos saltator]